MKLFKVLMCAVAMSMLGGCASQGEVTPVEPTGDGYIVKFNTHGGTSVAEMKNVTVIESSPLTTKEGFVFNGWFDSMAYENKVSFPYAVTKNITLHAGWKTQSEIGYTVRFNSMGGSMVADAVNVTVIEQSPVTKREGYNFAGWYDSIQYTNQISFPYTVTKDIILYAKWEENTPQYKDVLQMELTNAKGTAKYYMAGEYKDDYIEVRVRVEDSIVFNSFTNQDGSVNGMNDNVELYISPSSSQNVGLIKNQTLKILVIPNGPSEIRRFLDSNDFKNNYQFSVPISLSGVSIVSELKTKSNDGYDGYMITFRVAYSVFSLTKADMLGDTSLFLAARNTNADGANNTIYGESTYLAGERRNAWTHPMLNAENKLVNREVDTILIGSSYTDSEFYKRLNVDFAGKDFHGRGISGARAIEWSTIYYPNIIASKPKTIVMGIGLNDIHLDDDKIGNVAYERISGLFQKVHNDLPNTKIYWWTIPVNHFKDVYVDGVNPYLASYAYVNEHMAQFANSVDYLDLIDFCERIDGNATFFLADGLHANNLGYDMMTKLIYNKLGYEWKTGTIFGEGGKYVTSRGYDLCSDANGTISAYGEFNQYAWVKSSTGFQTFNISADFTVTKVNHGDAWPKLGFVFKVNDKMLFYYIDMYAALNGRRVGYVIHEHFDGINGSDFHWGTSVTSGSEYSIDYTNGNYATLKASFNGSQLLLKVGETTVFSVDNPFGSEKVHIGILSFNTSFSAKDIVVS